MQKLKIKYLQCLPHQPEDLPIDVVEVYIGISGNRVDLVVGRHDFIAAHGAMQAIVDRIHRLIQVAAGNHRSLGERLGISPRLNPEWCRFLDALLQQEDSWAFVVHPHFLGRAS